MTLTARKALQRAIAAAEQADDVARILPEADQADEVLAHAARAQAWAAIAHEVRMQDWDHDGNDYYAATEAERDRSHQAIVRDEEGFDSVMRLGGDGGDHG